MISQVLKNEGLEHRYHFHYWSVKELEMSGADVARRLKISKSAVSRSVVRWEKIATDMELKLIKDYKRNKSTPSL